MNVSIENAGRGAIIINPNAKFNKIIWYQLDELSDFPPHTFQFIDLNQDNEKDLLVYGGMEDVFNTYVYINQIKKDVREPFKLVLYNSSNYLSVIDPDKDQIAEIILPLNKSYYYDDGTELIIPKPYKTTDETLNLANKEYDRLVGNFDQYNFNYNMPEHYKLFALDITKEVQIISFKKDTITDVSGMFPDHFRFRDQILNTLKEVNEPMQVQINGLKKAALKIE